MPGARPHLGNQHRLSRVRVGSFDETKIGGSSTSHNSPPVLDIIHARKLLKEMQQPHSLEQAQCIVEQGALPNFVRLLESPNADVRSQAMGALGNIASMSPTLRDSVLQSGALDAVLEMLGKATSVSMLRDATRTVRNFCCGKPSPPFSLVSSSLTCLANLLHSEDVDILTDACLSLAYLTDAPPEHIAVAISAGISRQLVKLLLHESTLLQAHALRVVRNIAVGNVEQKQVILNSGALPFLLSLLTHGKRAVRKHSCCIILHLTTGSSDQIAEVIHHQILPSVVHLFHTSDYDIKKVAVQIIRNVSVAGFLDQHVRGVACIRALLELLSSPEVVEEVLDILECILREPERGLSQNLQTTMIKQIESIAKVGTHGCLSDVARFKANEILERYCTYDTSPKNSMLRQSSRGVSPRAAKATNVSTPRTPRREAGLAHVGSPRFTSPRVSPAPVGISVERVVGSTQVATTCSQMPLLAASPSSEASSSSMGNTSTQAPPGSIFGSIFGGNTVAVQNTCGNIFGGAEHSSIAFGEACLTDGVFYFGEDSSESTNDALASTRKSQDEQQMDERSDPQHEHEKCDNLSSKDISCIETVFDSSHLPYVQEEKSDDDVGTDSKNSDSSDDESSMCTYDDLDANEPALMGPQDASCSWEWPLTRDEKKVRVSELERNMQMMDKQRMMQELEDLREFRKRHEAAWKEFRKDRRNSIG